MSKTAIITDSDSSLPGETAAEYGIIQVPIRIHFKDSSFESGVNIDDGLLFKKIAKEKFFPSTSAPCPEDFNKAFKNAFAQGAEHIVCICVSNLVSSTYQSALTASENFPDHKIKVIDSLNMSMGQGFMVMAAAEAAANGASIEEITTEVERTGKNVHTLALLSTLKYLALSGRVDKFVANLANTFNIKPILTVCNGKLDLLAKIRTHQKAMDKLYALLNQITDNKKIERMAIIHVNDLQKAVEMEAHLWNTVACPEKIVIAEFSPGLSVHTGPGVVGVIVQTAA